MGLIKIKSADPNDLEWVNAKYDEVAFHHSTSEDFVVIASYDGKEAGLGRLVKVDDGHLELGGIYVFHEYRGLGIAQAIVSYLNNHPITSSKIVWCLPFQNLINFYLTFGFSLTDSSDPKLPKSLYEKTGWCLKTYKKKVDVLVRSAT